MIRPLNYCNSETIDVVVADKVKIGTNTILENASLAGPNIIGRMSIVKNSSIGQFSTAGQLFRCIDVDIGAFCSIGDNVLMNAGEHPHSWLTTHIFPFNHAAWDWCPSVDLPNFTEWKTRERCTIGNDVWVGVNAVILTHASIGDGAVIAAGAVVHADVPPYAIVGGVPSRIIGYRFNAPTIARLLSAQWWNLPIEKILSLPVSDINACLDLIEEFNSN